jgi:hypothetical protein
VATKAPSGRETGASAQAAIHLQLRAVLSSLSYLNIGQCQQGCPSSISGSAFRPVFSRRRVPAINREPRAAMASGCCASVLIFYQPQACPACFKGGVTTLNNRPYGHVGLRREGPVPGIPALPRTRHCQVVWGSCPMTVPQKRICQPRLSGGQKH